MRTAEGEIQTRQVCCCQQARSWPGQASKQDNCLPDHRRKVSPRTADRYSAPPSFRFALQFWSLSSPTTARKLAQGYSLLTSFPERGEEVLQLLLYLGRAGHGLRDFSADQFTVSLSQ